MITTNYWMGPLKAALDVLCFPVKLLDGRGRVGGIVGIALAVLMLFGGAALGASVPGLALASLGALYFLYGLSLLVGRDARLAAQFSDLQVAVPKRMTHEQIAAELKSRPLPFFVCTRCRIAMDPGHCGGKCLSCKSEADCMPVYKDDDRSIAAASVY